MHHDNKIKVAIVGAGREGLETLALLRKDPELSLLMLVDPDKSAVGFRLGEYGYRYTDNLDLGFSHRFQTLSSIPNLNLVIDTEPAKYHKELYSLYMHPAEIMSSASARLIWEIKSKTNIEEKRLLISGQLSMILEDLKNNLSSIPHAHSMNEVSALILRASLSGVHADSAQFTIFSKDGVYKILKDVYAGADLLIRRRIVNSCINDKNETDKIIRSVVEKKGIYQWEAGTVIPIVEDGGVTGLIWLYYTQDNIDFKEDDTSFILSLTPLFGKSIKDSLEAEKSRLVSLEEGLLVEPVNIIRSEKSMEQKLNEINIALSRLLEADDSHIYVRDPATGDLVLQATTLKFPFLTGDIRIKNGAGVLGEVVERRKLLTLSETNLSNDDLMPQFAKREDTVSILYIPLVAKDEGVGVLTMEFTNVHNLTSTAMRSLEDIGQQLAGTISSDVERHRMSRKILKLYTVNEEGIEILSTVDIEKTFALSTSSSAMLFDSEISILRLFEDQKLVVKSTYGIHEDKTNQALLDIDFELSTTVLQTKIPIIIHDLPEYAEARVKLALSGDSHYKTAMVVPVIYERELLGTLSCYNKMAPEVFSSQVFSDDDREIAERFIQYIARGIINARRYNERQSLITIDDVTGLRNERYLQMRFPEEIKRARRYNRTVSLIFLDVKPSDDIIIHDVSNIVKETFRYIDVLVRLKESKFAILLPDTGASVKDAATRIAASLGILKEKRTGLTIYIGYSTYPYDSEDMHELIKKASKLRQY